MTATRSSIISRLLAVLAVLMVVAVSCGSDSTSVDDAAGAPINYRYVIPGGTGERIDAGEPVQIVPARLDLNIGDSIEIVNYDTQGHTVGPFYVGEGETVSQTFNSEADYLDTCTIHPSGEFRIVVS